ncbi:conjugative transposon protein TraK [Mucilaginibacter rubeus]|uniref:Conjugative transposon protein TraK n=1 Tax=Mucilaginibacter rubeus TaxID=2027860 RepID=A0AAE6MKV5_9SPHI|nr:MULTISPECIES: conjugative transposon protein TraK [Mucilaginibacter]QEM07233.1 conjugative transposon protein TraK [Mucilaginibacter rubeus]QEM19688.1 conjugative transposon protein TraK [Mucilaginibacter gossypii]QTE43614.1 conjugative transposon protein TraK [Mucilaginibacter rubeus]QTE50214.1 conjugative transposon protein TraK [Mucilaginibacter rubeus]QTE55302.1 conjugative transposon protein TraK [Mucilaginibacter rubeus]
MIIKNIESKVRLATFVAAGSFVAALIIVAINSFSAYKMVSNAQKTIYILDNNVPILARQTDMQMNRPAEYRAHVDLFHSLFFSLTPDDNYMEYQMKKAMYLVDESGMRQYNDLKENGFFNSILSSSSVLTLQTDSIAVDMPKHYFRFYGKLKIDRRSSTVIRSLITEGYLKDIPRSDNNPHGVLITNWKTLENKDLQDVEKNTF